MESWQLEELQNGTTFRLTWLGEGLFRIENNAVHMDLLVGTHQALLWDTGYGYDDLYTLVRRITDLPLFVVNSHGHVDHVCGNCQFDSVFIHEADMELCRFHNSPPVSNAPVLFRFAERLFCRGTHPAGLRLSAACLGGRRF